MKRTPLQRKTPLKSKTPIKRGAGLKRTPLRRKAMAEQSERKQNDRAWFEASKAVIRERSGGQCEFWTRTDLPPIMGNAYWRDERCHAEATDAHHISRQSQGHDHSPDGLMDVCRAHHSWIHDHVAEARALGYLSPAKRGDL